jgi:DNA-binding NarL/FixJ family response regulator
MGHAHDGASCSRNVIAETFTKPFPETQPVHTVLLLDDHDIVRFGLSSLLTANGEFRVISQCATLEAALAAIPQLKPDLVISDLSLAQSKGLSTVRAVVAEQLPRATIFLSMHDEIMYAEQVLACGAKGYMMKERAQENIVAAARTVMKGDIWVSPAVNAQILRRLSSSSSQEKGFNAAVLSTREAEILSLLGSGKTTKEIAHSLALSPRTVDAHRARIKQKLGVKSIAELIVYAAGAGS